MQKNKYNLWEEKYYLKVVGEVITIGYGIIDFIEAGPQYRLRNPLQETKNTTWCGNFVETYLFDSSADALSEISHHVMLENKRTQEIANSKCAERMKNLKKLADSIDSLEVQCDQVSVELCWMPDSV